MTANFYDPQLEEWYYVNAFSTKRDSQGKFVHYAFNRPLIGREGEPLVQIPLKERSKDNQADFLITGGATLSESTEQYNKKVAYLKQRAKNHARSPEGRQLKHDAKVREYSNMGFEKK